MKILRISLANLASLSGRHTVDFTREPLRSAGLYSISGPTGSGKSTLLDALCLALYEETPRLKAARGGAMLTDVTKTISQNDPRNLLTRGAAEGFAEVVFVGVDGEIYTARWSVKRARNRADGNLQSSDIVLLRGDVPYGTEGVAVQSGKKTEVLPCIVAKLGLPFEQFTRAVLLAQNEFATFLKADDTERAKILQALTGTERFEHLSRAVYARCLAERNAVAEMEARLEGHAPLPREARDAAEAEVAAREAELVSAKALVETRAAQAVWFVRLAELQREALAARERLTSARAAREQAEPRRAELTHTARANAEARPLWEAEQRAYAELAAAERQRTHAAKAEEEAQKTLAAATQLGIEATALAAERATALEAAKPALNESRALDARLLPLAEHLKAATAQREHAERHVKAAAANRDALERQRKMSDDERTAIRPQREALAPLAAFAPHAQAWRDRLDRTAKAREALDAAQKNLTERQKEEEAGARALEQARAKEPVIRAAAETAKASLEAADAVWRTHDGEKIAEARKARTEAITALRKLQEHLREVQARSEQRAAWEGEVAQLRAQDATDAGILAELRQTRLPRAEAALAGARRAYELAEAAVQNATIHLREKLAPGEACPVCGAVEHPYTAQPPPKEAAALRALREDAARQEKALTELRAQESGLQAAATLRQTQIAEKTKALGILIPRLAQLGEAQFSHPVARAIATLPETERLVAVAGQLEAEAGQIKELETADEARRAAEKRRDGGRADFEKAAQALAALEKKLVEAGSEQMQRLARRESAASAAATAEADWQTCTGEIEPILTALPESRTSWARDPAGFRQGFVADLETLARLEKRQGELDGLIREADAALAPARVALAQATADGTAKVETEAKARTEHDAVRVQRAALFGGRSADAVEQDLGAALRLAVEARDRRSTAKADADKLAAAAAEAARAARQASEERTMQREQVVAGLTAWLEAFSVRTGRTFDRPALAAILARDDAWIQRERESLEALEMAVNNALGAAAVHEQTLEAHLQARPTTEEEAIVAADLSTRRAGAAETERRRDEARARVLADDQRRTASVQLTQELEARRAKADPWERLNDLIGSADGAKFRAIAQRRSLDLLLGYANAQLDQLSERYHLARVKDSLNLLIIDRDMGDEQRSVHSLSGGESFLVSLALALALASLTSNRLRIESLFIDEGFGSLDPETLNIAMGALMRLEAQGRKVGVISHVSEMADAIPVQIRVVKGRGGASRLVVPGAAEEPATLASPEPPQTARMAFETVAARMVEILEREAAAGVAKVSARALRDEIGCGEAEFRAARESLAGRALVEGRSLRLAPPAAVSPGA